VCSTPSLSMQLASESERRVYPLVSIGTYGSEACYEGIDPQSKIADRTDRLIFDLP